jgi:drug/metabolite transporter (DMT)-like permease
MLKLVGLGLLSGLFFSATFILNRAMSLEGGHWVWSASLRYAFMILFLVAFLPLFQGMAGLRGVFALFFRHWRFWVAAGSIGFGGFYSLLCFSADHAPGWVVATTWQLTIMASLVVLRVFGRPVPARIWGFTAVAFLGVVLVNTSHIDGSAVGDIALGAIPVLLAAFCYPTGNQLVWEAAAGHSRLPAIHSPYLDNPFNKVILMSLGTIPFWSLLVWWTGPPPPSNGQIAQTALVALSSGVVATSLFLFARNAAKTASELAAVDATQSSEVVFAVMGEVALLGAALPPVSAVTGIVMVFAGLTLFIWFQKPRG